MEHKFIADLPEECRPFANKFMQAINQQNYAEAGAIADTALLEIGVDYWQDVNRAVYNIFTKQQEFDSANRVKKYDTAQMTAKPWDGKSNYFSESLPDGQAHEYNEYNHIRDKNKRDPATLANLLTQIEKDHQMMKLK